MDQPGLARGKNTPHPPGSVSNGLPSSFEASSLLHCAGPIPQRIPLRQSLGSSKSLLLRICSRRVLYVFAVCNALTVCALIRLMGKTKRLQNATVLLGFSWSFLRQGLISWRVMGGFEGRIAPCAQSLYRTIPRWVGRYLLELGMPLLALQEEGRTPPTALWRYAMHLTKPLPHVTWKGMIAATQPMCAAQEYSIQPFSLGSV